MDASLYRVTYWCKIKYPKKDIFALDLAITWLFLSNKYKYFDDSTKTKTLVSLEMQLHFPRLKYIKVPFLCLLE